MAAERLPRIALPKVSPSIGALGLPLVSYAGLGAASVGALTLLNPYFQVAWHSYALVGACVGLPVASVVGQLAFLGGPGIAKAVGGEPGDARLVQLANEAADAVGVEHPHVYMVPKNEPNAFAASGLFNDKPTVAVTAGLRSLLSEPELGAVLAHEMGHLRHKDVVRNMHVAAAVAGLGGIYELGRMLLESSRRSERRKRQKKDDDSGSSVAIGLGLMAAGAASQAGAHLVRMAASRSAEFKADRAAAEVYGAESMVSALRKIEKASSSSPADLRGSTQAKAFAHMMISDGPSTPSGKDSVWRKMGNALRTHPTVDKRVAALELAAEQGHVPARARHVRGWFR